ncbi:MFS transporter, partial [bacterium]
MTQTEAATPPPSKPKRSLLAALALFGERRTLVMLGLGFGAGLPNMLIFDTLSTWLREAGLSLEVISFFALATLSYSLKFIWAPLIDRTAVFGLTRLFGHRRSWMLLTQAAIILGLFLISGVDPAKALGPLAAFAVLVGFAGASQDVVIDAWRIEAASLEQQGPMLTAYQWGYRVAIIVAGAVPLIMASRSGWNSAYAFMAALMGIAVLAALFAPREAAHKIRPIPVGDIPSRPALEVVEWIVRLVLIAFVALVIGTGLTAQTGLLASILHLGSDQAEALKTAWAAKPGGVYLQVAAVFVGLGLLVLCCWPLPGLQTRPGAYLAGSFGAPLKDFFDRFGGLAGLILA